MSDDAIEAIRRLYGGPHHAAPPGSVVAHIRTLLAERDAALARAEAAERERDERGDAARLTIAATYRGARRAALEEAIATVEREGDRHEATPHGLTDTGRHERMLAEERALACYVAADALRELLPAEPAEADDP